MTIAQADFIRQAIYDRARGHGDTGDHGITMNGVTYHKTVWELDGRLYVFYRNIPVEVAKFNDRYLVK